MHVGDTVIINRGGSGGAVASENRGDGTPVAFAGSVADGFNIKIVVGLGGQVVDGGGGAGNHNGVHLVGIAAGAVGNDKGVLSAVSRSPGDKGTIVTCGCGLNIVGSSAVVNLADSEVVDIDGAVAVVCGGTEAEEHGVASIAAQVVGVGGKRARDSLVEGACLVVD